MFKFNITFVIKLYKNNYYDKSYIFDIVVFIIKIMNEKSYLNTIIVNCIIKNNHLRVYNYIN